MTHSNSFRVLIVDDEPKMTKLLKLLLEEELGCKAEICNDSVEAYHRLQLQSYDAISLDHRMPKLSGLDLLKKLRSGGGINADCPVLIFTGYLEEVQYRQPETLEHVLLLEKPIDDQRFLRNMKMALQMGARVSAA